MACDQFHFILLSMDLFQHCVLVPAWLLTLPEPRRAVVVGGFVELLRMVSGLGVGVNLGKSF